MTSHCRDTAHVDRQTHMHTHHVPGQCKCPCIQVMYSLYPLQYRWYLYTFASAHVLIPWFGTMILKWLGVFKAGQIFLAVGNQPELLGRTSVLSYLSSVQSSCCLILFWWAHTVLTLGIICHHELGISALSNQYFMEWHYSGDIPMFVGHKNEKNILSGNLTWHSAGKRKSPSIIVKFTFWTGDNCHLSRELPPIHELNGNV